MINQLNLFNDEQAFTDFERTLIGQMGYEWYDVLRGEFKKEYMKHLYSFLVSERRREQVSPQYTIYPSKGDTFRALKLCPYSSVKVVIMGQDPYHDGRCTGLAFANPPETPLGEISPSLKQIFEAVPIEESNIEYWEPDITLESWAKQGVLLLNRVLTTRKRVAGAHRDQGWEEFTEAIIKRLNFAPNRIAYLLWGNDARTIAKFVETSRHLVHHAEHPAAACYKNRLWNHRDCFLVANEFLEKNGGQKIFW